MSTKDKLLEEINFMSEARLQALLLIAQDLNSIPNAETLAAIDDAEHGRNLSGPYATVDELMEALDADD